MCVCVCMYVCVGVGVGREDSYVKRYCTLSTSANMYLCVYNIRATVPKCLLRSPSFEK